MESLLLRKRLAFWLGVLSICLAPPLTMSASDDYDEALVIERLKQINDPLFELKYNSVVKGYLKGYLSRNRRNAELITGRAVLYYPIIEACLEKHGMPEQLKYLPVVESALKPHAISPVGACGLWQFMPGTALDHGLKINEHVDERLDPHKSTEAAIGYLRREYKKYGDWALALAAYNGGSGRVSRAIKRGRSKNFWRIRRYLPRETRNYVPAYIAATYLMEYYKAHGIQPDYPGLELQITESIRLYNAISFYRIAQLTGLSIDLIKRLNPAYKRDFIPADERGHYLILPKRVMPAVEDYIEAKRPDHLADQFFDDNPVKALPQATEQNYNRTSYFVKEGETLPQIARELKCTVHQLQAWNQLQSDSLWAGQELIIYYPKKLRRFQPMEPMELLRPLPALPLNKQRFPLRTQIGIPPSKQLVQYYLVQEKQRLREFSLNRPHFYLPKLLELNQMSADHKLRPGDMLRVVMP